MKGFIILVLIGLIVGNALGHWQYQDAPGNRNLDAGNTALCSASAAASSVLTVVPGQSYNATFKIVAWHAGGPTNGSLNGTLISSGPSIVEADQSKNVTVTFTVPAGFSGTGVAQFLFDASPTSSVYVQCIDIATAAPSGNPTTTPTVIPPTVTPTKAPTTTTTSDSPSLSSFASLFLFFFGIVFLF